MPCACCCREDCPCETSADCAPNYACCNGVCRVLGCGGCAQCLCTQPDPRSGAWTEAFDMCEAEGHAPLSCDLIAGEFLGVGSSMGVQWAEGFLQSVDDCTLMVQAAYDGPGNSGVYWKIWKCDGITFVDVTASALAEDPLDPATLTNGWWCHSGACNETPSLDPPVCDGCLTDTDCSEGECCVDGVCSSTLYCLYRVIIYWDGDPENIPACPSGFSTVSSGVCVKCESVEDAGQCDEQVWYGGVNVPEDWTRRQDSLIYDQTCDPQRPFGACESDSECCFDGVCIDGFCEEPPNPFP